MANEARVTSSLQIFKRDESTEVVQLDYQSRPTTFLATVLGSVGPTPGSVSVSVTGTDVNLSALAVPGGLCRVMNKDTTNRVEYGIYDPQAGTFYPLGEILPGETYVLRLSRNIAEEFSGTVTGTGTLANNSLRFKAYGGSVEVLVEAFDG